MWDELTLHIIKVVVKTIPKTHYKIIPSFSPSIKKNYNSYTPNITEDEKKYLYKYEKLPNKVLGIKNKTIRRI